MATTTEMEMLAGKALHEKTFRHKLLANPVDTAASLGIQLDQAQVDYIKGLDPAAVDKLAAQVHGVMPRTITPAAWGG